MRIIGGLHKGRRINPPRNLPVRPTTDMAKEALVNILNNQLDFENAYVLDLFAGTGNLSFEFASREANEVISIDQNIRCINFVKDFAKQLGLNNIKVIKSDTIKYLSKCHTKFDIIFADPPYDYKNYNQIVEIIFENKLLESEGIFILEHSKENNFSENIFFQSERKYGHVHFSFFRNE